jgi:hypothetical protein
MKVAARVELHHQPPGSKPGALLIELRSFMRKEPASGVAPRQALGREQAKRVERHPLLPFTRRRHHCLCLAGEGFEQWNDGMMAVAFLQLSSFPSFHSFLVPTKWSGTSESHGSSPIRTEYAAITTRARGNWKCAPEFRSRGGASSAPHFFDALSRRRRHWVTRFCRPMARLFALRTVEIGETRGIRTHHYGFHRAGCCYYNMVSIEEVFRWFRRFSARARCP